MKRLFVIVLTLALLLCGCGQNASNENTTEATVPSVTTEEALNEALKNSGRVELGGDIALSAEVVVRGNILNGGGYTLTGPTYVDGKTATENGITLASGTVENVTVKGAYRGIGDSQTNPVSGDVRLEHVSVDSDVYVLNFAYGSGQTGLYVSDSTLQGWTSYTKFNKVSFTQCTFGWSESGKYGTLRPYVDTTLSGCKFEGKTEADGTVIPFNISFKPDSSGILLVLEDCYVGETLITQENVDQLLNISIENNTIDVRNQAS